MQLVNVTGLPAKLFRTILRDDRIAAAVVARVTYALAAGKLTRAEEQPWIVSSDPWQGPEGKMPSDEILYRGGVDLLVFGRAWTPRGRPAPSSELRASCGDFQHRLVVFGDRVWRSRGRAAPAPTPPAPFTNLPLTLAHAFGGRRPWDGIEVAFPDNPDGKGYHLSAEDAADGPLPNIEDPRAPVQRWNDAPAPVGVGVTPPGFGPRLRESLAYDPDGHLRELKPTFFNVAFPAMVIPRVEPGQTLRLEGVSPDGPVDVVIPPLPLRVTLRFGAATVERALAVDQVGVQVDQRRVFVTYRYPFRYFINREELRSCQLALVERGT